MNRAEITIFIPTYNAEAYIDQILKAIYKQDIDKQYEVLVIDSGSTDGTLEIVAKFPEVRLHQIPNSEFGHGKTRQLAANMAKGEYVVYISHDAVPSHDRWLYEILKPFELNDSIIGVMGKQIPRYNCPPIIKYEINSTFGQFGPDFGTTLFYKDDFIKDQAVYDAVRFYSDVNSAAKKSALLSKVPYKDVPYAEDQLFGEDILEAGLLKAYAPRGSVVHSNDVMLREYSKRIFDETFGLKRQGSNIKPQSMVGITRAVVKDSKRILRDRQYSTKRKLYWLIVNPLFHLQRRKGQIWAVKTPANATNLRGKSLEHERKGV